MHTHFNYNKKKQAAALLFSLTEYIGCCTHSFIHNYIFRIAQLISDLRNIYVHCNTSVNWDPVCISHLLKD